LGTLIGSVVEVAKCKAQEPSPCILHPFTWNPRLWCQTGGVGLGHTYCSRGRMLDLIFVAVTVGFFALSIVYTRGCDRL